MKCSNCGARWTALPEAAPATAPPPPNPVAAPAAPTPPPPVDELVIEGPTPFAPAVKPSRPTPPSASRREANGKVAVWVASAVVIVGLVAAAIVFRAQVVQLMPASQAAYAGIGLPVSSLVIEQVHAEPAFQGGRPVLSVTGQLHNVRATAAVAAPLRVSLLDRFGKPVATKIARPLDAAVPPHSVRHFAISIVDPPASAHDLEVTFEPARKGAAAPATATVAPAAVAAPSAPTSK